MARPPRRVMWGFGGERGAVLYLEGLEEAASSSSAGAVLHFVIVAAQAHHGLAVDVQLLVQGLQQGGTRALLNQSHGISSIYFYFWFTFSCFSLCIFFH